MTCAVSLALVLALDVSGSVSPASYDLQVQGTADAVRAPDVVRSIEAMPGGVAVTVIEWASTQQVTIPWRRLRTSADVGAFADALAASQRTVGGSTALGDAIRFGLDLLPSAPCTAERLVIDVSGDGPENSGSDPDRAVAIALDRGVTVNGLAIVTKEEPDLADYYRQHVATPGGRVFVAESWGEFRQAIRAKVRMEVAGVVR